MNQDSVLPDAQPAGSPGIPVVGLGGSAGALASYKAFFRAMPGSSGAAFVVIQHVSPSHKSLLPDLLAEDTGMRVVLAAGGMKVEPNCVYIIPSNHNLGLRKGVLFLADPTPDHGRHLPIDFFFRCLAEDRENLAIGILFSGGGADGTLGARAIRGAGGIVLAQDPGSAQFGEMPRSAVIAGLADYVLVPERMPQVVVQYLEHPYVKGSGLSGLPETEEETREVKEILALVLDKTGNDFRCYKPATMLRRIGRRMGLLHIADTTRYLALLHHRDPNEIKLLLKDLLINVTGFFRDPAACDELRDKVLAPLVQSKLDGGPLRVWVPACATGEEAYSLSILLLEQIAKSGKNFSLRVFATDLDDEALGVARAGFYPENIAGDVGKDHLETFFVRKERGYQVKDALREVLTFATQNVITDPPFSRMDLISCRNLLIYLNTDAQAKLMALFNFALKPGGHLFLGRSETIAGQNDLFESASKKARIYRRLTPSRPLLLDSPILPGKKRMALPDHLINLPMASNFADVVRMEILRHFGASAVLADRKGTILQFYGQTDRYLNLPATGPNFNVCDLAKEKLPTKLRLAMHKAIQDGKTVIVERVPFTHNEAAAFVNITVTPVLQKFPAEPLLVIFFEDADGHWPGEAEVMQVPENEAAVKRLEEELRVTQQDLQATIQELQSSNEELRAANEEVTSTNEELESTNEELVSSTEELQSTNEELTTAVSQLQEKVDLLEQARSGRKKAEEALSKSEERFRILVEASPNAILLTKKDGTITFLNSQAESMFGYTRNELIGHVVEALVPVRFREKHPVYRDEFAIQPQQRPMGAGRDLFAVRKNGAEFPAEIGLTPLDMPEGPVTLVTITDITVRKRLEEGA